MINKRTQFRIKFKQNIGVGTHVTSCECVLKFDKI